MIVLNMNYVYISLILAAWGIFGVLLLMLVSIGREECNSEKKKYNMCKAALEESRKLVQDLRAEYNKRLKEYTQYNKLAISIYEAMKNNRVKIICPQHNTPVQVLTDGTIICSKGHRLWPVDEDEEAGEVGTGELQED